MKKYKKISIIILIMLVFLIGDQIRVYANSDEEVLKSNLNIENLIEYINNLDLSEEEIQNISDKSKTISNDIKVNASFKDYKLTDIIKIYKNFASMSNDLKLNIDFSIKNGDFTLKDKANGNSIFKGNVSEIKKYFEVIKNNTELLTTEVLANIDNETIKETIKEILSEDNVDDSNENFSTNEDLSVNEETETTKNNNYTTIESEEDISINEKSSINNKLGSSMIIPTSILVLAFLVIIISYIKFR
ncbi:hypothetical protein ACQPVP_07360 [Clostridium nigeriense]|uniref:hypothetical protein n=1 Tax=Clostridium nigeriense TaxID=1805470 RepID=UPI003D326FE7